jgi:uncharacterized protein (TIGR02391 family)
VNSNNTPGPEILSQFEDRVLYHIVELAGDRPLPLGQGVSGVAIAVRLADELNISQDFPLTPLFSASEQDAILRAAVQELKQEGLLEVEAVFGSWKCRPTRAGRQQVVQWREKWRRSQSQKEAPAVVSPPQRDVQEAWREVAKLRRELQLAKQAHPSFIADEELRRRCEDLLVAEKHFDRAILQACVVLEDRVRSVIGADAHITGVPLMEMAFSPRNPQLRFSAVEQEQLGAMQLYRGTMAFFRNVVGHHIIDTYTQDDALRFISWVDLLLTMLKTATTSPTIT